MCAIPVLFNEAKGKSIYGYCTKHIRLFDMQAMLHYLLIYVMFMFYKTLD